MACFGFLPGMDGLVKVIRLLIRYINIVCSS